MGGSTLIQTTKEARIFLLSSGMESHARLDVVWPESKQIGLIDSVIRNYYIPPLIFGKLTPNYLSCVLNFSNLLQSCFHFPRRERNSYLH